MQLLGSGTILREVIAAADLLAQDFNVAADVWSCPSFRDSPARQWRSSAGTCFIRQKEPRKSMSRPAYGTRRAGRGRDRLHAPVCRPDRPFVPRRYRVLGTDGFGRSDYRKRLRDFFEVDRRWIAVAALKTLRTRAR